MGPYAVIVADPGWPFDDKLPDETRGAVKNYRTMALSEIKHFPLPELLPDCTLFLWRVSSMQFEALAVIQAWGFILKSEIVWIKKTKYGNRWFGMGRTVRNEHETCLIATRGHPLTLDRSIRSTFEAPVGRHSEKPDEFYSIVERLRAGPYIELFARKHREGWDSVGDEL